MKNRTANLALEFRRAFRTFSIIGSCFGAISDVLSPLAPILHIVAIILGVLTLCVLLIYLVPRLFGARLAWAGNYLGRLTILTVIFFLFSMLGVGKPNGFLAANFDVIAQLQSDWLGITAENVEAEEPESSAEQNVPVVVSADWKSFLEQRSEIRSLVASGQLIESPVAPRDVLVSAMVLYNKGDYRNAVPLFETFLSKGPMPIDILARYYEALFYDKMGNREAVKTHLGEAGLYENPRIRVAELAALSTGVPYYAELEKLNISDPLLLAYAQNLKSGTLYADAASYGPYGAYIEAYWSVQFSRNQSKIGLKLEKLQDYFLDYPAAVNEFSAGQLCSMNGSVPTGWRGLSENSADSRNCRRIWQRVASGALENISRRSDILITGQLLLEDGSPAGPALITDMDYRTFLDADEGETSTDENGRFTIRTGRGHLLRISSFGGENPFSDQFEQVGGEPQMIIKIKSDPINIRGASF